MVLLSKKCPTCPTSCTDFDVALTSGDCPAVANAGCNKSMDYSVQGSMDCRNIL